MTTNVLLINRQLVFAVTIKQALEQTGLFAVHPFTSADAALDYLRGHPHEVALVDFTLPDYNGPQLVRRLRAVQPNIAVIVSPAQPNARVLMQELDLQGVVDAPFSARTIIPVIEHAVELIEQPLSARTRSLVEGAAPDTSDTDVLDGPGYDLADALPPGDAERFGGAAPHTRVFDADSAFDSEGAEAAFLSAERGAGPDADEGARPGGATRLLDDDGDDEDEALPWERPAPIDFSSLGSILLDEAPDEYEPPAGAEDTPAVPTIDSDAVRQFLATSSESGDDTFGSVLDAISPEAAQQPGRAPRMTDSFDDLVNSMRSEREHTPLPDRHQQFVELILTGGMDNLLHELEKAKTGPLMDAGGDEGQPAPPDSFAALAAEEPPLPTLEESGTIGDLMIGVGDTSFRNVLALMRGEQAADSASFEDDFEGFFGAGAPRPAAAQAQPPEEDAVQEIDDFFAEMGAREPAPPPQPAAPPQRDRGDTGGIPARMILETAQDESTPADSFSLDTLIDDIERQLEQHSPDIKPLPSWGDAVKLPRRPAAPPPAAPERFVAEPDFLPETFAEPELPRAVTPLPTWEDAPDEAFETTIASQAQREQIEAERDFQETEALAGAPEAEPEAEPETEPEPEPEFEFEFDPDFAFEFESEGGFEPEAPPPDEEEPAWPAEVDIAAAWESFVPAGSDADDGAPAGAWADEDAALSAPAEGLFYSDETLTDERAPDEAAPDWIEGLALPPVGPALVDGEATAAPAGAWELAAAEAAPYSEADDPYIAQLALSLTQVSLELTAEATLLTRDGEVAASAGTLAPEDIGALRAAINDRWEPGKDEARINFVALDGGVREYMLYSRQTAGGFTLTMVFGGATPLRDIRRQGKRLLESLAAVPDTPLPPAAAPPAPLAVAAVPVSAPAAEPAQAGPLAPYTYMWLLRDPEIALNAAAARAITAGLRAQLSEQGWQVRSLEAQGEYVYVYADVPGERAAYAVVDELKRRAADILHAQFAAFDLRTLWAESYLVMAPGRELDADEIAQFIDFERLL